jgi:hypothetical protein
MTPHKQQLWQSKRPVRMNYGAYGRSSLAHSGAPASKLGKITEEDVHQMAAQEGATDESGSFTVLAYMPLD